MAQLKKIHDSVFVSDRILTYKVVAAILNVNINEAKDILQQYVKEHDTINVSYIIGGVTLNDEHKIRIVPQNKYEISKKGFKSLTINHIYSIQKSVLTDWVPIFNVNDFLFDKNDKPAEIKIKHETPEPQIKKEIKSPTKLNKKHALSNFLNNTNNKQKTTIKTVKTNEPVKKQEKNTAFTNFFNKGKENVTKTIEPTNKIKEENSDDEDLFKVTKKRSRVLTDEDFENPSKCQKVDILDDPEEQYRSDEDIFGSPEKDEQLMHDTETSTEKETPDFLPEMDCTKTTENNTETTENNTETTENNTETTENSTENNLFEDDDGYFVTEKKKTSKAKSPKREVKKEVKKEEKKNKRETKDKLKNSTNQKSILSFFQKK